MFGPPVTGRGLCGKLALLSLLVICSANHTEDWSGEETMSEVTKKLLSSDRYDKKERPPPQSKPTILKVGFYVETLASISELDMDFMISIYLRQQWRDPRLTHNSSAPNVMVDAGFVSDIWLPSIFFVNGKDVRGHDTPVPTKHMTISHYGTVFYSQKLSVRLYCGMNLYKFPFDEQICPAKMETYTYNSDGIDIQWLDVEKPVEMKPNLELPEFVVESISLANYTSTYITGSYSTLEGRIHLTRRYLQYVIQIYVPSALMVMLSWANFWIDHRSTPARVSLALLCILTITTQSSGAGAKLPKVAYVKAIDVWMAVCLAFVFGAFIEFTVVNIMARRMERDLAPGLIEAGVLPLARLPQTRAEPTYRCKPIQSATQKTLLKAKTITSGATTVSPLRVDDMGAGDGSRKSQSNSCVIDIASTSDDGIIAPLTLDTRSRVLFPLLFMLFNIIYWVYYLIWL